MYRRIESIPALYGLAALGLVMLAGLCVQVEAKVFLTRAEALELAFPGCDLDQETHDLSGSQVARAEAKSGVEIASAFLSSYRAQCDGEFVGTAYFDSHMVRTLPETIMIVISPESEVVRIEVVEFREPDDYIPSELWYDQFEGRSLDPDLQLKGGIRNVTGATLTARATTEAARRILALHGVIEADRGAPSVDDASP